MINSCLVIGGNGFIGSWVTKELVKRGHDVVVFSDFKGGYKNLEGVDVALIKGDFLDIGAVGGSMAGVDQVFHFAATTVPSSSVKDPVFDIQSNVVGSVRLMEEAVKRGVKKFVFASSGGTVYGDLGGFLKENMAGVGLMKSPYGIGKYTVERYLEYFKYMYGLDYTVLRYSNPYGPGQNPSKGQGVIGVWLDRVRKGLRPVIFGDGATVRDFIYVEDAAEATVLAAEKSSQFRCFNVGSGQWTTLNELLPIISGVTGKDVRAEYVEGRKVDISAVVLDIRSAKTVLGWQPKTSLEEGIRKTWLKLSG